MTLTIFIPPFLTFATHCSGRLAMVGIMGMVFETLIFGKLAIF